MTAISLYVGADAIVMAADGVCYDYDAGVVAGYFSKLNIYPERNAVIACSGMGSMGAAIAWEINQSHSSFDELVADFPEICFRVHYGLTGGRKLPENDVCVVLAGLSSERQRYEAYRLVSYAKSSDSDGESSTELKLWRLYPIETGWCSTRPSDDLLERFRATPGDHWNAKDWCVRMVAAARASSGIIEQDDGSIRHYLAGGFCQVAVLADSWAQTWIAHRWPDPIGKPIDPTAGEPLPQYLMDLDREQT